MVLGRSRGLCVRSWVALGASAGGLGSLLGPLWAVLDSSWGLCGRSWVALGASAGDLGRLLGLCRRSWAALGAFVGDLGPLLGPFLAVVGRLGPKSGPNPSGKAIWQADLGREVAQTRAGRPFWAGPGRPSSYWAVKTKDFKLLGGQDQGNAYGFSI